MKDQNHTTAPPRKPPVYQRMLDTLRQSIDEGILQDGRQIPSETELANQYRISRSSVRQGLNQLQKQGKIQKISGKGTYVRTRHHFPDIAPAGLSHKTVSFVVPNIEDPFVARIHSGIVQVLESFDYALSVHSSESTAEMEAAHLHQCLERGSAGIILMPLWGLDNAREVENLEKRGVPLVLVDRSIPNLSIDCVASDNFRGGVLAIDHLFEMGHRRIGMIRGVPGSANDDRYRGYCAGLDKWHLPLRESLLVRQEHFDHAHEPLTGGHHEMALLMQQSDPPTAVFACNDSLAFGAEQAALKLGLKIPQDVSIVGFDDLQYAQLAPVPLTTIHQPGQEIGRTAAELLVDNIRALAMGPRQKVHTIELVPRLVVRQSVRQIDRG